MPLSTNSNSQEVNKYRTKWNEGATSKENIGVKRSMGVEDKFKKLMQKDWNSEFIKAHQNLNKLNQKTREAKELQSNPGAYMKKLRSK